MTLPLGDVLLNPEGEVRNGWKALAFLLALSAGNLVAFFIGLRHWPELLPSPWRSALVSLLVTWAFLHLEGRPLASVGLRLRREWAGSLAAGTLGGIALMGATTLVIWLAGGLHLVRSAHSGLGPLVAGAWLYLGVALGEELDYRGYLFQRLEWGIGPWATQGILALFFAVSHWSNPGMAGATKAWATLNIALAGLLLGLCYLRTRSLALPIGLHLGWNWAQGSLLGFGVSGTSAQGWWTPVFHDQRGWLSGGAFGLEGSLPCAVLCTLACLGLAWMLPPKSVNT